MPIQAAVELPCPDVVSEADFLVSLGWRVSEVFPADDPRRITVDGHGLRIAVVRGTSQGTRIVVADSTARRMVSPHGTEIVFESPLPTPSLTSSAVVSRAEEPDEWHVGRAGMQYRDLVPDRQGGAIIASHIRIPVGGPVPDYPHFHEVVFQLIFCHRGWVRLAYESQGEPFVLREGECVIQPPRIRHRVLESSDDLHVVEIGYPAEHLTVADHDFDFTAVPEEPNRTWDGQRFVRFTHDHAAWTSTSAGVEEADTGVADATQRRADVRVVRLETGRSWSVGPVAERLFRFVFVLHGRTSLTMSGPDDRLGDSDSVVVPVGATARFTADEDTRLLSVSITTD